ISLIAPGSPIGLLLFFSNSSSSNSRSPLPRCHRRGHRPLRHAGACPGGPSRLASSVPDPRPSQGAASPTPSLSSSSGRRHLAIYPHRSDHPRPCCLHLRHYDLETAADTPRDRLH
uniref:Uncharacterized protein n=1 Tax=Triticum urartu TaxID=4572 RepID=A0A8R7U623_TRIUA